MGVELAPRCLTDANGVESGSRQEEPGNARKARGSCGTARGTNRPVRESRKGARNEEKEHREERELEPGFQPRVEEEGERGEAFVHEAEPNDHQNRWE